MNGTLLFWCILLTVNVGTFAIACIEIAADRKSLLHRGLLMFAAVLAGACIARIIEVSS